METTATTLKWFVLYMLHYPDIQEKIYQEICSVSGQDQRTSLSDKPNMPYLQATILEVQRIASIADTTLFHTAKQDTQLGGYRIPADSTMLCAIYCLHMDPVAFPEPEKFNPDRFLEEDGKTIKRNDHFLPFGAGKRVCLGESLAKMELFKIPAALIQRYKFQVIPGRAKPSTEAQRMLTVTTLPYECVIRQR